MGCFLRGGKNGMGRYVRGDKNSMGCFVQGGKSLWDVLSRMSKNGMGCFVLRCFVRLPLASGARGPMFDSRSRREKIWMSEHAFSSVICRDDPSPSFL